MSLQIGSATESVTVSAEAAQVQLNSSEKSQTVDSKDLEDLTLKGRDLFGYIKLVPGVIDTASSRDVTSHGAISGMNINGATSALNFTVDGVEMGSVGLKANFTDVAPTLFGADSGGRVARFEKRYGKRKTSESADK